MLFWQKSGARWSPQSYLHPWCAEDRPGGIGELGQIFGEGGPIKSSSREASRRRTRAVGLRLRERAPRSEPAGGQLRRGLGDLLCACDADLGGDVVGECSLWGKGRSRENLDFGRAEFEIHMGWADDRDQGMFKARNAPWGVWFIENWRYLCCIFFSPMSLV